MVDLQRHRARRSGPGAPQCQGSLRRANRQVKRFFKKLLKGLQPVPRVIVTDKLKSHGAAKRKIMPGVENRQSRYLNNRAKVSHQPTRRRERQMQRFKSTGYAQRFLSAYGLIYGDFRPRLHRMTAGVYRMVRSGAFRVWQEETCGRKAA